MTLEINSNSRTPTRSIPLLVGVEALAIAEEVHIRDTTQTLTTREVQGVPQKVGMAITVSLIMMAMRTIIELLHVPIIDFFHYRRID